LNQKVGGQNTLRPPTSKSGGTCPPIHPMINAHGGSFRMFYGSKGTVPMTAGKTLNTM